MEREKDEVETRGNSKEGREERQESLDRVWKDKDKRAVVEVG